MKQRPIVSSGFSEDLVSKLAFAAIQYDWAMTAHRRTTDSIQQAENAYMVHRDALVDYIAYLEANQADKPEEQPAPPAAISP